MVLIKNPSPQLREGALLSHATRETTGHLDLDKGGRRHAVASLGSPSLFFVPPCQRLDALAYPWLGQNKAQHDERICCNATNLFPARLPDCLGWLVTVASTIISQDRGRRVEIRAGDRRPQPRLWSARADQVTILLPSPAALLSACLRCCAASLTSALPPTVGWHLAVAVAVAVAASDRWHVGSTAHWAEEAGQRANAATRWAKKEGSWAHAHAVTCGHRRAGPIVIGARHPTHRTRCYLSFHPKTQSTHSRQENSLFCQFQLGLFTVTIICEIVYVYDLIYKPEKVHKWEWQNNKWLKINMAPAQSHQVLESHLTISY